MIDKHLKYAYVQAVVEMLGKELYETMTKKKVSLYDRVYWTTRYETIVEILSLMDCNPSEILSSEDLKSIDKMSIDVYNEYRSNFGRRFPENSELYKNLK